MCAGWGMGDSGRVMDPAREPTPDNGFGRKGDPVDALRDAVAEAGALKGYAEQYLAAKVDLAKLKARRVVMAIALGVIGLVAAAALVGVAVGMLMTGAAGGLGEAMGGRRWAGNLIVGGGVLALLGIGGWLALRMFTKSMTKTTMERYERKHDEQRRTFGADAHERAYGTQQPH